jgi:hypothetical protein
MALRNADRWLGRGEGVAESHSQSIRPLAALRGWLGRLEGEAPGATEETGVVWKTTETADDADTRG